MRYRILLNFVFYLWPVNQISRVKRFNSSPAGTIAAAAKTGKTTPSFVPADEFSVH